MPDFMVDIGGLDALGKNLDRTVENIEEALKKMKDIGPDSIGPDSLDQACADFKSDWEGGLDKIREAVDGISGGVDQAMQGYSDLEDGLEESLSQMGNDIAAAGGGS
jgi:hypothetical protein